MDLRYTICHSVFDEFLFGFSFYGSDQLRFMLMALAKVTQDWVAGVHTSLAKMVRKNCVVAKQKPPITAWNLLLPLKEFCTLPNMMQAE